MKVLALSGSPREASFTDKLLGAFIDGLGKDVELSKFYPHKMHIAHCIGCWDCWTKTRGVCRQKDDMLKIMPVWENADLIILAFPLYVDGIPSHVKKVLDRLLPLVKGEIIVDQSGHSRHPRRRPHKQKAVLISTCGFPEADNFDALKAHFKAICKNSSWENAGVLCVSAAGASVSPQISQKIGLFKQVGEEFIKNGLVGRELEENIGKEVFNRTLYRGFATAGFEGPVEAIRNAFCELIRLPRKD